MKRILLLTLCLIVVGTMSIWAKPRTRSEARAIALQNVQQHGLELATAPGARKMAGVDAADTTQCYFVFDHADGRGFTLVSGDDCMPDVIGYTEEGSWDDDNIPDGLRYYLECYAHVYKTATTDGGKVAEEMQQARMKVTGNTAIQPLILSKWSQEAPYNWLCPLYDGSNRSVTGCVATAMAQILYYHQNPETQVFDIPGYTTSTNKITIPTITGDRTYDWANMRTTYSSYSDTEGNAVAKLMYHCGVSVKMNYGSESGAYSVDVPNALINYFGMNKTAKCVDCSDYTTSDQWIALVDEELEADRPIYISGSSTSGGHAFVCSGRDTNGKYHINWGWGGYCDGYFDLTVLSPSGSGDGYNKGNQIVVGIQLYEGTGNYAAVQRLSQAVDYVEENMDRFKSGTTSGYCQADAYNAMQESLSNARIIIQEEGGDRTAAEIDAINKSLRKQFSNLPKYIIPLAGGYYYVKSDKTTYGTALAMYEEGHAIKYGAYKAQLPFLWKVQYDSETNSYVFKNAAYDEGISQTYGYETALAEKGTTDYDTEMSIQPYSYNSSKKLFYYTMRSAGVNNDNAYMCIWGYDASGDVSTYDIYSGYVSTNWTLTKVADATAQSLIDANKATYEAKQLEEETDALITKAKTAISDLERGVATVGTTKLITKTSQITSPYTETAEGSIAGMIDGDPSTYWHSEWTDGSVTAGTHYFQIQMPTTTEADYVCYDFTRRDCSNDQCTYMMVFGTNSSSSATVRDDCTSLAGVAMPFGAAGETIRSGVIPTNGFKYLRFYFEATNSDRGYSHVAEFQLYPVTYTQDSKAAECETKKNALQAQIDARPETATQEYYDALKAAYDALMAKYINANSLADALAGYSYDAVAKGLERGQYNQYEVAKYQAAWLDVNKALQQSTDFLSQEAMQQMLTNLKSSYDNALQSYSPFKEGQYYIESPLGTTDGLPKAIAAVDGKLTWNTFADEDAYLWNVSYNSESGTYNINNVAEGKEIGDINENQQVELADDAGSSFQVSSLSTDATYGTLVSIAHEGEQQSLFAGGYDNGDAAEGKVIGRTPAVSSEAHLWTLIPTYKGAGENQQQLEELIAQANTLCSSGYSAALKSNARLTNKATMYSSPFTDATGGKITALFSGTAVWNSVSADTVPTCYHYVQFDLGYEYGGVSQIYTTRDATADNQVTRFGILASNDAEDWTDLGEYAVPFKTKSETQKVPFVIYNSEAESGGFRYYRLYINQTTSANGWASIKRLYLYKPGTNSADAAAKVFALYKAMDAAKKVDDATVADVHALDKAIRVYNGTLVEGDVNDDKVVDVSDVTSVLNTMFSTGGYDAFSDVNDDGAVDVGDVTSVLNIMFAK